MSSCQTGAASVLASLTSAEIALLDDAAPGTIENSKAVVYGTSGEINANNVYATRLDAPTLTISGNPITSTAAELNLLDGSVQGTPVANTAVIADSNQNIGIVKTTGLHIGTSGLETEVTSTAAELSLLDGTSPETVVPGKALIYGSSGEVNATKLKISGLQIESSVSELNLLDGLSAETVVNGKAVIYGSSGEVNASILQIQGQSISASAAELNLLDESLAETVVPGKAVLYGSSGVISATNINTTGNVDAGSFTTGTLTLDSGSIIDSNGTISLGDDNLTTTGDISCSNLTSTGDMTLDNLNISSHNGTKGLKLGNTLVTSSADQINYLNITTLVQVKIIK